MIQAIKDVWKISWPLIIASSFWNIQLTIDRIFLGEYSTETLAATIAVTGIYWVPMALFQQTAAYVTTFVAQYLGAKQKSEIGKSVWQSIYVSLFGGLLFLLFIPFAPILFSWVGHSKNLQELEVVYFQALSLTGLPTALIAACSGFFTGLGQNKIIMAINGLGMLVNIGFDYLLIFGNFGFPELGIVGAGLATTLSGYVAATFGFYFVFYGKLGREYKIWKNWQLDLKFMSRFLKYGVPSGLQWALEGMAFTIFLVFIGRMPNGDAALAASSITVTIMMLAALPAVGVGQGVSALVGQLLGQNEPEKAARSTWAGVLLSMGYITIVVISFLAFPQFYLNFFKSSKTSLLWQQVTEMVPYLLMFVSSFILFDAININLSFALKGAGDTRFVSLVALCLPWPLMVLPTWYVSRWESGVYWAWGAASFFICVQALVFLYRFLGGYWKNMLVT